MSNNRNSFEEQQQLPSRRQLHQSSHQQNNNYLINSSRNRNNILEPQYNQQRINNQEPSFHSYFSTLDSSRLIEPVYFTSQYDRKNRWNSEPNFFDLLLRKKPFLFEKDQTGNFSKLQMQLLQRQSQCQIKFYKLLNLQVAYYSSQNNWNSKQAQIAINLYRKVFKLQQILPSFKVEKLFIQFIIDLFDLKIFVFSQILQMIELLVEVLYDSCQYPNSPIYKNSVDFLLNETKIAGLQILKNQLGNETNISLQHTQKIYIKKMSKKIFQDKCFLNSIKQVLNFYDQRNDFQKQESLKDQICLGFIASLLVNFKKEKIEKNQIYLLTKAVIYEVCYKNIVNFSKNKQKDQLISSFQATRISNLKNIIKAYHEQFWQKRIKYALQSIDYLHQNNLKIQS